MKNRVRDVVLRRSALIIVFLLVLGAVSLLRLIATHKDVVDVAEVDIPLIETLTRIETNQLEQSINFERAIRYGEERGKVASADQNFAVADSLFRFLSKAVDEDLLNADYQVAEALDGDLQDTQRGKLKVLHLYIKKLEGDHTTYENHALEVLDLLEQGKIDDAIIVADLVEEEEEQFNKQIEGVLMRHEMFTESVAKRVEKEEVISMKWVSTLTLVFVILSLVAVYVFSSKIWGPLEDIREGAAILGSGDFDHKMKLRTTTITEDVVEAFNDMAERLKTAQADIDRFISFSYTTAHDLKAPIINMKSLLGMLDREKISSSHYDTVLSNAKKAADKLETTVGALIEFNQIRENLGTLKTELDFEEVLKEVAGGMITQIKEAEASIRKDFSNCPIIEYPKPHLVSILQNLLSNAIKYRDPDKKLVIQVKTTSVNGHAVLTVRDNGLGFDAIKDGEEVLKPFVRLHSHTEGTGLGTYIIKTILDYHKGSIRVESEPKKGAKFILRLD